MARGWVPAASCYLLHDIREGAVGYFRARDLAGFIRFWDVPEFSFIAPSFGALRLNRPWDE